MYLNGDDIRAAIDDLRARVAALEARPDGDAIVRRVKTDTADAIYAMINRRLDPSEPPALPPTD